MCFYASRIGCCVTTALTQTKAVKPARPPFVFPSCYRCCTNTGNFLLQGEKYYAGMALKGSANDQRVFVRLRFDSFARRRRNLVHRTHEVRAGPLLWTGHEERIFKRKAQR